MKMLQVKLTDQNFDRLAAYSSTKGESPNTLVRKMVDAFIEKRQDRIDALIKSGGEPMKRTIEIHNHRAGG